MFCFLSTYPPQRCGIATYTEALAQAMAATGAPVTVLAERGAAAGTRAGVTSQPVWDRRVDWVSDALRAVRATGARVVHVQHTPDTLGWDSRVPRFLEALAHESVRTAITLHTVHSAASGLIEARLRPASYHRALAAHADTVVVHGEAAQAERLRHHGVPADRIRVIPHGTLMTAPPSPDDCRRRLGLPVDGPLLLYFGFVHAYKNVHTILLAMRRVGRRVPEARLLLAGSIQNPGWYNRVYGVACRHLAGTGGFADRVIWRDGFVDSDDVPCLYGAADIVLLPHGQYYGSASGVLHQAIGAGRVPVCSRSTKFAEVAEHVSPDLVVPTYAAGAWADRIVSLLVERPTYEAAVTAARRYAEVTAWPRVAAQHLALYEALGGPPAPRMTRPGRKDA